MIKRIYDDYRIHEVTWWEKILLLFVHEYRENGSKFKRMLGRVYLVNE